MFFMSFKPQYHDQKHCFDFKVSINQKSSEEALGVEPRTYRTAADCSTTELYLLRWEGEERKGLDSGKEREFHLRFHLGFNRGLLPVASRFMLDIS